MTPTTTSSLIPEITEPLRITREAPSGNHSICCAIDSRGLIKQPTKSWQKVMDATYITQFHQVASVDFQEWSKDVIGRE